MLPLGGCSVQRAKAEVKSKGRNAATMMGKEEWHPLLLRRRGNHACQKKKLSCQSRCCDQFSRCIGQGIIMKHILCRYKFVMCRWQHPAESIAHSRNSISLLVWIQYQWQNEPSYLPRLLEGANGSALPHTMTHMACCIDFTPEVEESAVLHGSVM